eukprot:gene10245-8163_t
MRGLFPASHFKGIDMRNLEGMHVKMLTPKSEEARRMIDWVEGGVYDAVKSGYLKTLFFGISRDPDGSELFEEYVFSFAYGEDEVQFGIDLKGGDTKAKSMSTKAFKKADVTTVRYQVTRLMRMLVELCNTLDQVPESRYLFCRMAYYDHTPDEYEPPHFKSIDPNAVGHFSRKPFSMKVGDVLTNHHDVGLRIKSILDCCGDGGEEDDQDPGGSEAAQCSHGTSSMDTEDPDDKAQNQMEQSDEVGACGPSSRPANHEVNTDGQDHTEPAAPLPKSDAAPFPHIPANAPQLRAQADLEALMTEPQDMAEDLQSSDDETECPNIPDSMADGTTAEDVMEYCKTLSKVNALAVMQKFPSILQSVVDDGFSLLLKKSIIHPTYGQPGEYTVSGFQDQGDEVVMKMDYLSMADVGSKPNPNDDDAKSKQGKMESSVCSGLPDIVGKASARPSPRSNTRTRAGAHQSAQIYLDASQHSGQKTKRLRKASFVVDPIHQTLDKVTKPVTRSRIGRMG